MSRVFGNGPGDRISIPGRVIPKTQTMVPDAALVNTQHYKVRVKDKVEQSRELSSKHLHRHLGVVAIEKGAFGSPSTKVADFTYLYIYITWGVLFRETCGTLEQESYVSSSSYINKSSV